MGHRSDTRGRVLDTSAQIFRRQGYVGTGLKQIVTEGDAPIGSIYHFFPDGKEQLGAEALARSGARYEKLIDLVFERSKDTPHAVATWFRLAADALESSDYADGCPIATVALEVASTNAKLRAVCADVFASWQERLAAQLRADGVGTRDARALASFALACLEGTIILSRTARDTSALRANGALAADAVRAAIPARAASRRRPPR